jgi:amidase
METMAGMGAVIVEIKPVVSLHDLGDAELAVLCYEFKDGVNRYLAGEKAPVGTLREVIEFNLKNKEKAMPYFQQELLETCESKGDLKSKEYLDAYTKAITGSREAIDRTVSDNKLDAICGLVYGPAYCIDLVNGDYGTYYGAHEAPAMAGYPHITVPAGQVHGLPVGLNFFGKAWSEGQLISIAYAFEQATKHRMPPGMKRELSV